ncbi:hypothetical protein Ade02nite_20890 [Paractinoplanes deccanensis]|uniref:Uncharacterized protein n=1 Tax=Paractinoplanes deccanensis TaxID=113561 RepID=A0ABQ3Y0B7_9ACTN|nr:hypothetical protein [Actinoplanes deccanensis]GID73448.1 hypothetical protein Ade02nite_20890 [Actinoplanes deccanensis]
MTRFQVVEKTLTGIIRHEPTYATRREAEEAAAEMANRLTDNDPTEIYAEEVAT